jgi:endonuclease/exonuclease/phosphatase family metal-dependent hydrolase
MKMMFWNLAGLPRHEEVSQLARIHDVDLVLLSECPNPESVSSMRRTTFWLAPWSWFPTKSRVKLFFREDASRMNLLHQETRWASYVLFPDTQNELLLTTVHLRSGLQKEKEQNEECRKVARKIAELEEARKHHRSLVIGDFNANPEDARMYSATGFHAVTQRHEALRLERVVDKVTYRFFYNPMARFAGQQLPLPSGTYYWYRPIHDLRPWNTFDQVLLRPDLLPHFEDRSVEILTTCGDVPLHGRRAAPNPKVGSDHFPILVTLSYPGGSA